MTGVLGRTVTARSNWQTADRFVLRLAGMPIQTAQSLRFPRLTSWADEVLATEAQLSESSSTLSDALHEHIRGNADDARRGPLVNLRRQVFNNRLPRDVAAVRDLLADAPAELVEAMDRWLAARSALESLQVSGTDVSADETERLRAVLRRAAAHPRFRHGLLLASATLDTYLDSYLLASGPLNKRARRVEHSLLEYLYKISCKTSPFSTFTGVSISRLGDASEALLVGKVDDQWAGFARVNVAVLGRLISTITSNPAILPGLSAQLTPGWSMDLDRVRFVRRTVTKGDDDATVSFDTVRDSLFFLQRNGTLRQLLEILDSTGGMPVAELVERLEGLSGDDSERCTTYVQTLIGVGLIWLEDLQIDVHADDPLEAFSRTLRGLHRDWADAVAEPLEQVSAQLAQYPGHDLAGRRAVVRGLRELLLKAFAAVGETGGTLPQTLLFEDARAADGEVPASRHAWQDKIAEPLQRVSDVLPAFDLSIPGRLTLKAFFLARYGRGGRCDDVLRFLHEFTEDIYDEYNRVSSRKPTYDPAGLFTGHENWLAEPSVDALNNGRLQFGAGIRALWQETDPYAEQLELGEGFLEEVARTLQPVSGTVRPQGFFLQLGGTEAAPEVVLNRAMSGLSFAFSRFTHCFRDRPEGVLADQVREANREVLDSGAVLAEIVGGVVNSNLNIHGRLTDYQIVCPAEVSSFPVDNQLELQDLYVCHDVVSDRLVLRSRRLDREIVPVYLGYLMPTALPEIARTLLLFSPMGMAMLDIWGGIPDGPSIDGVTYRPRVRHRNVVLSRRSWAVSSSALPVREPGESDAAWFLRWRRWQQHHQLPDQVFVTVPSGKDENEAPAEEGEGGGWTMRSKPSYVDFTSLFSVTVLDSHVRKNPGRIQFEEMKPAEDELYVRSSEGSHVCEMAVELTRITIFSEETDSER